METYVRSRHAGAKLILVDQTLRKAGGHYLTYNRSLAAAARDLGLVPIILASNRLDPELDDLDAIVPTFSGSWHTPEGPIHALAPSSAALPASDLFARELMLALRRIRAARRDHIFIHTLGFYELPELHRVLLEHDLWDLPRFHILCRRDLDEAAPGSHGRVAFEYAVSALAKLQGLGLDIRFYTDTPELSAHYSRECGVEFVTLPLPFDVETLSASQAKLGAVRESRSQTQLCYLGDARDEKGYQHIPSAINSLPDSLKQGAVKFVLQSNFNSPQGEPEVAKARSRLQMLPPQLVELRLKPLSDPDYFDVLAASDACLIPYDQKNYQRRSSGVFTEAIFANVLPIVPAGTSMSAQLPKGFPTVYSSVEDLAAIIERIHSRKAEYFRSLERVASLWRKQHSPKNLIMQLLCAPPPNGSDFAEPRLSRYQYGAQVYAPPKVESAVPAGPGKGKPCILHVVDLESFYWKIGAGFVQHLQVNALSALDAVVAAVMIVHQPLDERAADERLRPSYWARNAEILGREVGYAGHWIVYERTPTDLGDGLLSDEVHKRSRTMPASGLLKFLEQNEPSVVYSNYAQNHVVVEKCGLQTAPLIIETHDIQSHHKALFGGQSSLEDNLKLEKQIYQKAAAISCLTDADAAHLQQSGLARVSHCLPLTPANQAAPQAIAGLQDLAEVLSASGSKEPLVNIPLAFQTGETSQIKRLFGETRVNMLFIGGWHLPNIEGLKWFFDEVFKPFLEPKGKNLFVVGGIFPERSRYASDRIFWAGRLDVLDLIYAAADVVVAPLLQGTGVNVKVLEALSWGKPVVATSTALRGIHGAREVLGAFDEPKDFAARALYLLDRPKERSDATQATTKLYERLREQNNYTDHVERLVRGVIPGIKRRPGFEPARQAPTEKTSIGWTPATGLNARVIRSILEKEPNQKDFEWKVRALKSKGDIEAFRNDVEALFVAKTPVALQQPDLAAKLQLPGPQPKDWGQAWRRLQLIAIEHFWPRGASGSDLCGGARKISQIVHRSEPSNAKIVARLEDPKSRSGIDQSIQAEGFDFLVWTGPDGEGEAFAEWLFKKVMLQHPILRDTTILLAGPSDEAAFVGGNVMATGPVERIDPLMVAARHIILPCRGTQIADPEWYRAALLAQACGKPVFSPELGKMGLASNRLTLAQDANAWLHELTTGLETPSALARSSALDLVEEEELALYAPSYFAWLDDLDRMDLSWSPAHSALATAFEALEKRETVNARAAEALSGKRGDLRFAAFAASQLEAWLQNFEAQSPVASEGLKSLWSDPSLQTLLDALKPRSPVGERG